MKKKMLIGGVGVMALGVAAYLASSAGIPAPNQDTMERLRGTEGYYADSETQVFPEPGGELVANLSDGPYVKLKFDVEYKLGKEWTVKGGEAAAAFAGKAANIRSALIILLGSKKSTELKGADVVILKEEIVKMLNETVFPKKWARVEDIIFKELLVQK